MKHVCAWCKADIRRVPATRHGAETASHGICESCLMELERHQGTEILALVEAMPQAAIAVDGAGRIRAANRSACELLRATWVSLLGRRFNAILGCDHASDRGEGRGSLLCPGCEIQRLVVRTFESGTPGAVALPTLDARDPNPPSSAAHLVTTLRAGEVVALRIDPLVNTTRGLAREGLRPDVADGLSA
jgi:PAS domain-containing protein